MAVRSDRISQLGFVSADYNHFEDGVLFASVEEGLEVLWTASFVDGRIYKENLAYFVNGGLLISPNLKNTPKSACMSAMTKQVRDGKLFVNYRGAEMEVLAIIHTHPSPRSLPMPTPRNDYQFGYLGIHSYVMGYRDLLDAYKDESGFETYDRLGAREEIEKIPFVRKMRIERSVAAN